MTQPNLNETIANVIYARHNNKIIGRMKWYSKDLKEININVTFFKLVKP